MGPGTSSYPYAVSTHTGRRRAAGQVQCDPVLERAGGTPPAQVAASKTPTLTTVWRIADGFETQPSDLLAHAERLSGEA
jgi:hypothetical protein